MTQEQLKRISKSKDPDVLELLEWYNEVNRSQALDSLLTMIETVDCINKQVKDGIKDGKIDLLSTKDDPSFNRLRDWLKLLPELNANIPQIRSLLTEEEKSVMLENHKEKKSREKNTMMAV